MGYVQLIIILLFVGIAIINALTKIYRRKSGEKKKGYMTQTVHYPTVEIDIENEDNYIEPVGGDTQVVKSIDVPEIQNERDLGNQELDTIKQKPLEFQDQGKDIYENEMERYSGEKSLIDETVLFDIKETEYSETKKSINRIKNLPFFKQAVVMSEILGKPKGI